MCKQLGPDLSAFVEEDQYGHLSATFVKEDQPKPTRRRRKKAKRKEDLEEGLITLGELAKKFGDNLPAFIREEHGHLSATIQYDLPKPEPSKEIQEEKPKTNFESDQNGLIHLDEVCVTLSKSSHLEIRMP